MNKQEYYKYLTSIDWLIKKSQFVNIYLKENWSIECYACGSTYNLQVHHSSYENIGNEIITDGRIWDLRFMCKDCHKKWHKEKGFKEKIEAIKEEEFKKHFK